MVRIEHLVVGGASGSVLRIGQAFIDADDYDSVFAQVGVLYEKTGG